MSHAPASTTLDANRTPLFRAQALAYATVRQYGSIVLLRPAGLAWFTAVFWLIAALVLVFFATADYTRKEAASGVLVPVAGPIRVQAPQSGLVLEVRVREDQAVNAGDVLFVLAQAAGDVDARAIAPLRARRDQLAQEQRRLRAGADRNDALRRRALALGDELARVDDQLLANAEAPSAILVRAPLAGVVSGIATQSGQTMAAGQTLANVSPADTPLEAELHVSARAVGVAQPGMPVQIRYRAYPFQKFGQFSGVVSEVSRSPLADPTGADGTQRNGEAQYRIRVRLARQDVPLARGTRPLMAGMALDASLLLETRKLYEWALEPLRGIDAKG